MKKTLPLHPFLFGLFPVLFVYSQNVERVQPGQVWPAALLMVGGALLLLLSLALILRHAARAGAVLALLLLLFFSYGPVYRLLWQGRVVDSAVNRPLLLLAAWGMTFAVGTALILRTRSGWAEMTRIANVVAVVLVVSPLLSVGLYGVRNRSTAGEAGSAIRHIFAPPQSLPVDSLPDIYYIILDGYARADVLRDLYGYDNAHFLQFLAERGFYVAGKSRANYAQTALSLASSLNASYLDQEARQFGLDSQNWDPLTDLIAESAVLDFLKQQGYSLVAFSTGFNPTDLVAADFYMRGGGRPLSDLDLGLLLMTPIPWLVLNDSQFNAYAGHAGRVRYILDHLPETAGLPSPHFVFAHIISPHPPFVFDASGNEITPAWAFSLGDGEHFIEQGGTREEYVAGYADQLAYISLRVEAVLDELLAGFSRPSVVILQSDHGPGSRLDWGSPEKTELKERMSILNAYLLPGEAPVELHDEITPVNTFRLILNRYFGANLELLEDRSYFSTWEHPYRFLDVTDQVRTD